MGVFFLFISVIYYPLFGGILVAFPNKIFKIKIKIEEIAIEIAEEEEAADEKKSKDLNNAFEESDIEA